MVEHRVQLENFYGPLDLLLYLIKENELDITRIPIARVAEQYNASLAMMQKLDIDMAGEFLVMASQLMLIKSRSLLPPPEAEEDEEEDADPSVDLIRKLLEYKKYKDRGRELLRMADERALRHGRPPLKLESEEGAKEVDEPIHDVELWDLVLYFSKVFRQTLLDVPIDILYFDTPIEVFMDRISAALSAKGEVTFAELVAEKENKGLVIGTFLALLELIKKQEIRAEQAEEGGDIRIIRVAPTEVNPPVSG
ncbi:MAG: hypothetical protein A2Z34_10865 [Planctomycetes bacterium RBG_16_59_8]|nr:MAG: hypothetical protein A2Z34_10865 [Planctomycetes bacterium RBG_16_59_8]